MIMALKAEEASIMAWDESQNSKWLSSTESGGHEGSTLRGAFWPPFKALMAQQHYT